MKILKWKDFGMEVKEIVIGKKILLFIGQYEGLQFSISGLGLYKCEKEFSCKSDIINIYLGKLIISYNKKGYLDSLKNVDIQWEMPLLKYINIKCKNIYKYKVKKGTNTLLDRIMHKFFKERYAFALIKAYEKPFKFKSDVLTAYQLASNYEADLFLGNECLLSPLGYTWEENEKLIRNNLGRFFKNYRLLVNKDFNNVERIS
ncbi:hypothetical protein HYH96_18275 [Clostridium botulinum]|uniref:Uncharacterized protein n=1 Tax=Clostridium botulinum (strain Okra / Type B1) TaxID=498213 RepID=B1INJ6_CLOBK|nr:hypothetical protein [Clostridium botulinum]EKX79665.1 hypothetical protein CFSAN001628_011118 [Clostridium botulinum CFSAN001628]ACA47109.1 hypothetical protein CLD_A0019 [Clostridium botulinum B1 str. Okra]MBD5563443.1 hypothetical protein [Clostridium botulinum]MBD5568294.1 hypothetical protein [Clostridium botulinum]MBD5572025.1 hypothetical protein [Clostridium botulinum]